jgi:hypothetical protein
MLNSPSQRRTSETMAYSVAPTLACSRPVRVGVLIDSLAPPRWIKQILHEIRACTALQPSILLVQTAPQKNGTTPSSQPANALLRLWSLLDSYLRADEESATTAAPVNPSDYGGVVLLGSTGACTPDDLAQVKKLNLDVIVNLANFCPADALALAARRGLWSFAGSDPLCRHNAAGYFWQQRNGPVAADELLEHRNGVDRVVHRAFLASDPESPYRAQNSLLWRRSAFVVQRLAALAQEDAAETEASPASYKPCPAPTNLEAARQLAGVLASGMSRIVQRRLTTQHWFIAVRESGNAPTGPCDMTGFKVIRSPRHRYYADPFVIEVNGRQYVFVEDFRDQEGKGVISYFIYDGSQEVDAAVAVETDYHLSYPFLFRWRGDIFMMPETSCARRVEMFRAVEFPNRWERCAVLLDNVVAYDPTMLEYGGKFWLFLSGVLKYGAQNNDLSVFYADTPLGPWHPHPGNPVVSDPLRARPAGAIFSHGGQLYRPGQDCWGAYGRAITVSRIEELTERHYRETPVSRIEPVWHPGITGTHTFNDNGRVQVIDGRILAPRWGRMKK